MLAAQRRQLILRAVRTDRGAQVVDLAHRFGVSEITVRRDLTVLAREGKLTRVYGGAIGDADEPPFETTQTERHDAKERIGRAGALLVADGQTVMIDIGTTALEVARGFRGRALTVITSNLAVVDELLGETGIELVLLGGVVRRNYRSLVGVLAEDALRQLSADVAFIGTSGIRRHDLAVMDTTTVEVPIKRGMIAAATSSVLLADAQKFSSGGVVRICGVEQFAILVTDGTLSEPVVQAVERAGVEVVRA
ncbi:MAG TPA: DeoR/GlpR family DNA-binding transcription regulator [Jiangellaceae bacterium]